MVREAQWLEAVRPVVLMPVSQQKLMTVKRLTLVQSWGFFSQKISLFGCNVARAFSPHVQLRSYFCPYLGIKLVS